MGYYSIVVWVVSIQTNRKLKMSRVELFLFILKEHFKESNHIRRLDQSSRTGNPPVIRILNTVLRALAQRGI